MLTIASIRIARIATVAILLTSVFFLIAGDSRILADDAKQVFRAGAATSNITPPLGELIVGGWQPIPATNIHDELHARCLVLDDGKVKLAIVLNRQKSLTAAGSSPMRACWAILSAVSIKSA